MKARKNDSLATIGFAFVLGSFAIMGATSVEAAPGGPKPPPAAGCDDSIVKGDHGFSYTGSIAGGGGGITGIGSETCDETGHCNGFGTNTVDGQASSSTFTGVYTINPDCTGVIETTYADGSVYHSAVVVIDAGNEFHFVGTDPGSSYLGIEKRR